MCSGSTPTRWKYAKIPMPPEALRDSAAKQHLPSLPPLARGETLTITVTYRGGPECWYELRARGRRWRAPGHHALHDIVRWIYEGRGGTVG